jgi:hypothetical protein
MSRPAVLAALVTGAIAFALYRTTMLPGVELGDSASFQVMVGSPVITPRDGYPLYFAIAGIVNSLLSADPALVLNLASAVEGAVAIAIVALLAAEVSGSILAGAAAALMFAGSYTFWSQSIIAEVYALHVLLLALSTYLLLRWEANPTTARLAVFLVCYAVSFGNHLTMILMLPAYALFIFLAARGGWRTAVAPRAIALMMIAAAIGATPYLWNLRAVWLQPEPPRTLTEGLSAFWFDVTKADWRNSMILGVPLSMTWERLRMYAFDVHQQFGWLVPVAAAIGAVSLARLSPRRTLLLLTSYATTVIFALCYNVGDTHVFLLPSHLLLVLFAAAAIPFAGRLVASPHAVIAILMILTAARIAREYPALDRSGDDRATVLLRAITEGIDDRREILVTDLNWQVENGLNYFARHQRPDVAYTRWTEVATHALTLVEDNAIVGRQIIATERARLQAEAQYGQIESSLDERGARPPLDAVIAALPDETAYVLCSLRPSREFALNPRVLESSLRRLTAGRWTSFPPHEYACIAGLVGASPSFANASGRPFRQTFVLAGRRVEVRMDAWLAFDTIRRMGFGHVISARRHSLIVERGLSLVAFDAEGRPSQVGYEANIFAPQRRYVIRIAPGR